jgi:hypothetical protein
MRRFVAAASTVLLSLGLTAFYEPPPISSQPFPKAKAKAKGKGDPKKKGGPGGELRKAYDLLRRVRADDGGAGRSEERLREWTDRAAELYRDGLKALNAGDPFLAREYGAAAHDLARAADHARNGARFDRADPELPPPTVDVGVDDTRERARHDLYRAYERIRRLGSWQAAPGAAYYDKAARDLYTAARRDLEAGRDERGGELARAAEAMTHVPEHLARVSEHRARIDDRPPAPIPPPDRSEPEPEPKAKAKAKAKEFPPRDRGGLDLPPPLPPG